MLVYKMYDIKYILYTYNILLFLCFRKRIILSQNSISLIHVHQDDTHTKTLVEKSALEILDTRCLT